MAQYFLPPDQSGSIYGDLGSILGGLGQYASQQYERSQAVQQAKQMGYSDAEANFVAGLPPVQRAQVFNQKMKQAAAQQKANALSNFLGAGNQGPQIPTITNENKNIEGNLGGLSDRSTELTNKQRRDAAAASGLFDLNELEKIDKILGREEEAKERRLERQENRIERQEKLQRKDIFETAKRWRDMSKKADSDLHALEELKILREDQTKFTPAVLRRAMGKIGLGDFFKGKEEEAYGKITEGLVMDKAMELASSGKMTAALLDRVRQRFPSLENTPEGAEIVTNILGRTAMEEKVPAMVYNELRKSGGWKPGHEPIDILQQVDEIAQPMIEQMRKEADEELKRAIGYSANDEAVEELTRKYDPSGMPEGRIARNPQTNEPMAKIVNGKWVAL